MAKKRREVKGKGERERYTQLKAEFQRIARKNKTAFLTEQYKELKENTRIIHNFDRVESPQCMIFLIPHLQNHLQ